MPQPVLCRARLVRTGAPGPCMIGLGGVGECAHAAAASSAGFGIVGKAQWNGGRFGGGHQGLQQQSEVQHSLTRPRWRRWGRCDGRVAVGAHGRSRPPPLRHDHHGCRNRPRVEVLADRERATLESWLREHPGAEVVCHDGSATYAEAIRRALPDAVQVSDRWHLWRNLCDKVLAVVRAHAPCWATVNAPRPGGVREQASRERWHKVHALLDSGVGLLDSSAD